MEKIIIGLKTHNEDVLPRLKILSLAVINKNQDPYNVTLLTLATKAGFFRATKVLLKNGADPNGNTFEGIGKSLPISDINPNKNYKRILNILLMYRGDINLRGTSEKSLIYKLLENRTTDKYNKILYALIKGADPNLTREHIPLRAAFKIKGNLGQKLIYLLLSFGANPRRKTLSGKEIGSIAPPHRKFINNSMEMTLVNRENNLLLRKIVHAFKIPFENNDLDDNETRERICREINYIRKYRYKIDFNEVRKKREEKRKEKFSNNYTIIHSKYISEFTDREIISYVEGNNTWCFHVSEIPYLLRFKKNPWTQKALTAEFIKKLAKNDAMIDSITLEEAFDMFRFPEDTGRTIKEKIEILEGYISSHNTYVNVYRLVDMPAPELVAILAIIENQYPSVTRWKRKSIETLIIYQKRLLEIVVDKLIKGIRTEKIGIPMATYTIEQVMADYDMVKHIASIIGTKKLKSVINITFSLLYKIVSKRKINDIKEILLSKYGKNYKLYWEELFPAMRRYVNT